MWPFSMRRIFSNRWWAVAFVLFVCWQASDLIGDGHDAAANDSANSAEVQAVADALNQM